MSILPLHLLGSPVLRQRSTEVGTVTDATRAFIADLFDTMDAALGIGLAANQVGVAQRIAVIGAEGRRFAIIDPVILEASGREVKEEGCLSLPEIYGDVSRPDQITLEWTDAEGTRQREAFTGLTARCIQHEIDHLDGILFTDHLGPLKRGMLLKKFRKEHRGTGYLKDVATAPAGAASERSRAG